MNKPNIENLEKETEKKYLKRQRKKIVKMKVSSANVKNLGRIIKKSSKK